MWVRRPANCRHSTSLLACCLPPAPALQLLPGPPQTIVAWARIGSSGTAGEVLQSTVMRDEGLMIGQTDELRPGQLVLLCRTWLLLPSPPLQDGGVTWLNSPYAYTSGGYFWSAKQGIIIGQRRWVRCMANNVVQLSVLTEQQTVPVPCCPTL